MCTQRDRERKCGDVSHSISIFIHREMVWTTELNATMDIQTTYTDLTDTTTLTAKKEKD